MMYASMYMHGEMHVIVRIHFVNQDTHTWNESSYG